MTPREVVRTAAAELRRGRVDWERASQDRRDAIDDALVYKVWRIAGPYLHSYPTAGIGARIILGEKPTDVAPNLTKAEAHEFIAQTEHKTEEDYLAAKVRQRHRLEGQGRSDLIEVWRWVDRMLSSPKRSKALRSNRRIQRIDELAKADLCDSVRETFRNAEIRHALEHWDGPDELIPEEAWHRNLPSGVRVLRTATELFWEGKHQSHCVGDYAEQVYRGECLIVSVEADNERSTAEIRKGKVVQHLGFSNGPPPLGCVERLKSCRAWSYSLSS